MVFFGYILLFCHIVQLLLHSRHKVCVRGLFKVAGTDQAVKVFHACVHIIVDNDIVVGIHSIGLLRGTAETLLDHFRTFRSASDQAFL